MLIDWLIYPTNVPVSEDMWNRGIVNVIYTDQSYELPLANLSEMQSTLQDKQNGRLHVDRKNAGGVSGHEVECHFDSRVCGIFILLQRKSLCSAQEAELRETSISCKNLFLNQCQLNMVNPLPHSVPF